MDWSKIQALALQSRKPMIDILAQQKNISLQEALSLLSERLGFSILSLHDLQHYVLEKSVSESHANIVLGVYSSEKSIIVSDLFLDNVSDKIQSYIAQGYRVYLALPEHIAHVIAEVTLMSGDSERVAEAEFLPISQRFHRLLEEAMAQGASDIHLENSFEGLSVKYRVDGILTKEKRIDESVVGEQLISRIKVMADLDIAERRVPQDGRFSSKIGSREIDFRVSIMPGLFGEDAVIRILDRYAITKNTKNLSLTSIGLSDYIYDQIKTMIASPYGMILVTGPTGSGKTTTLYASINEINSGEDKIITIEDPIEYQLPGVLQIPVNEKKGLTFAKGLRSILRHDPDKIMVGEIRDRETAEVAIQAALTGHLVFTTVHANNVFDVIGRFSHMGVDVYNFVSSLSGVMAQRLIRLICEDCRESFYKDNEIFYKGKGCDACHGTGYKGRQVIAEILPLNDEIRDMIISKASKQQLKNKALTMGMISLRQSALVLVQEGKTTMQEVNRVTFME